MPRISERVGRQAREVVDQLKLIRLELSNMSAEMDRLKASVKKNTDSADSFIAYAKGISGQIRANAEDPEALKALADEIDATNSEMADAMVANTPAEGGGGANPTPAPGGTGDVPGAGAGGEAASPVPPAEGGGTTQP